MRRSTLSPIAFGAALLAMGASATAIAQTDPMATPKAAGKTMPKPSATPTASATPTPAPAQDAAAPAAPAASATPATGTTPPAGTTADPVVGGAPMLATKTIVENASAASNLTTLVTAVKAADLVTTLSGPGPFTVFAPTNDAFSRLAPGTVDTLMKPANKATLAKVLTYHVVAGTMTLEQIVEQVKAGGGKATLTTVAGEPIVVETNNGAISLTDVNGNKSYIETANVRQSNGMVHVVNGVLVPKLK